MNKKIVSFAMTSVMAFALAVSAAAEGNEPYIQVGGEVKNTTSDYTVVIPTGDFTKLDLGNVHKDENDNVVGMVQNLLGDVKVVRNEGVTTPFDSTKKVLITTASNHGDGEGNGALYNDAAQASLKYVLSNGFSKEHGDTINAPVFRFHMNFYADDINNETPQPLYLAVAEPTAKVPNGTYTDTLTFHVNLVDAPQ